MIRGVWEFLCCFGDRLSMFLVLWISIGICIKYVGISIVLFNYGVWCVECLVSLKQQVLVICLFYFKFLGFVLGNVGSEVDILES